MIQPLYREQWTRANYLANISTLSSAECTFRVVWLTQKVVQEYVLCKSLWCNYIRRISWYLGEAWFLSSNTWAQRMIYVYAYKHGIALMRFAGVKSAETI